MNKYLKAYLFVLLFGALYYIYQMSITMGAAMAYTFEAMFSGNYSTDQNELAGSLMDKILLFTAISSIISIGVYLIIIKIRKQKIKKILFVKGMKVENYIIIPILTFVLIILINHFMGLLQNSGAIQDKFDKFNDMIETMLNSDNYIFLILSVGIFAPIAEEVLFRGMILSELKGVHSIFVAVIVQAVLFGLFHMNAIQAIYATAFGLVLGFITVKTKSILPAILLHVLNNTFDVLVSKDKILQNVPDTYFENLLYPSMLVFIFIILFIWINPFNRYFNYRKTKTTE
jgi:membrane protease YdiL (CAAX protease family)